MSGTPKPMVDKTRQTPQTEVDKMTEKLIHLTREQESEHFSHWIATATPFDENVGVVEYRTQTTAGWQGWMARAALEDFRVYEVVQQERQSLAMMLRMCASRLRNHGHEDLGDKAVDLLRRLGLQGSPLRAQPQKLAILPPSTELEKLAEAAGMESALNEGSGSCVYSVCSPPCAGVSQEHLERFAELVRADERKHCIDLCVALRPNDETYAVGGNVALALGEGVDACVVALGGPSIFPKETPEQVIGRIAQESRDAADALFVAGASPTDEAAVYDVFGNRWPA